MGIKYINQIMCFQPPNSKNEIIEIYGIDGDKITPIGDRTIE